MFKHTPGSGLPAGPTQFSRAMAELGIQMIFAQWSQAKGRVEQTGGTFQDRLVAGLRLAGATTLEQAQAVLDEFVPRFNRRFGVPPRCSEPAFRPLDPEICLELVLCFKHRRKVDRDNTLRFQLRTLQLLPAPEPQLWRDDGGSPGRVGRPAQRAPRGAHHRCSGGPAKPGIPPQRPPASRRLSGCAHRGKPLG